MKTSFIRSCLIPRFAPLCMAAQVALVPLTVGAAPDAGEGPVTTAIYLQHFGPSDKPIFPVVIAEAKPAEAEISRVLGDRLENRLLTAIVVSREDLHKCLAQVTPAVSAANAGEKQPRLGAFRVTIAQSKDDSARVLPGDTTRLTRVLSPEEMPAVLKALEKAEETFAARNDNLRKALATLRVRTGVKEAK